MARVASNPFCVWFDCKMRTFKTLVAAQSFARSHGGRVGVYSEAANWWVEIDETKRFHPDGCEMYSENN